jgi:hypothetical protein
MQLSRWSMEVCDSNSTLGLPSNVWPHKCPTRVLPPRRLIGTTTFIIFDMPQPTSLGHVRFLFHNAVQFAALMTRM